MRFATCCNKKLTMENLSLKYSFSNSCMRQRFHLVLGEMGAEVHIKSIYSVK
jgi:hypothetical protein